ncbi:MAG TPA: hypothetical protein VLU46_12520 [Thermoanaerobaculia bacterium]|nr:hypothetical protein [Thermoanaerobaculia bacterium]
MTPEEWAEFVWEFGDRALRLWSAGRPRPSSDARGPASLHDGRSAIAAESAEMLVNARGGDTLERAEFARLFAIGEPQNGLRAFLDRRKGMLVAEKT